MSELIGQGGFGCIFYPGFNCKGNYTSKTKNIVTKLQVKDFTAENEIYIGNLIKSIPNYQLFFLPVVSHCSIKLAKLNKNYIENCEIVTNKEPKYLLFELPYLKNITFKNLFLNSSRTNNHLFLIFIETFKYLCLSIKLLLSKNIIHHDLKAENILYSTKYENPILIDYGLSIPMDKINQDNISKYFYIYSPDYYIWCLETHAINFLLHKNSRLTLNDINSMVDKYISNNSALAIFSTDFKNNYSKMCINYLSQFINKDRNSVIKELLKSYKTWDLYALSILHLKFLNIIFRDGFFENKLVSTFSELLLINISPDPSKRLSIDDTIQRYQDIFFINEKPENYLTLISNLNYKLNDK